MELSNIDLGCMIRPEDLEAISGSTVEPIYFEIYPTGSKVNVVVEAVPETIGAGIVLPDNVREASQNTTGTGWIMAAGPHAHQHLGGPIMGVTAKAPEDLLGLHVIFPPHAGHTLRVSWQHREFRTPVLMMDSKNIQAVLSDQTPLHVRVAEYDEQQARRLS